MLGTVRAEKIKTRSELTTVDFTEVTDNPEKIIFIKGRSHSWPIAADCKSALF